MAAKEFCRAAEEFFSHGKSFSGAAEEHSVDGKSFFGASAEFFTDVEPFFMPAPALRIYMGGAHYIAVRASH